MENKINENLEQVLTLTNRSNLTLTGTNKVISLKPDLIQLETNRGGLQIIGENLELIKLDNTTTKVEINGTINSLKFLQSKSKEPLLRKLFK